MKKVFLPNKVTLEACEQILDSLAHNPSDRIRLYLPSSLESGGILASEARLIQLIITIRQKYGTFEIASASDSVSEISNLELLAGRAYALAAFYLGSNYVTSDERAIPRRELMKKVARYVKAVDRGEYHETAPEQNANIVMLQGSRIEFPRPFYLDHAPALRDALQITREVESILKTILPSPTERSYIPKLVSPIGHSLRELLENIDDHASTDLTGVNDHGP